MAPYKDFAWAVLRLFRARPKRTARIESDERRERPYEVFGRLKAPKGGVAPALICVLYPCTWVPCRSRICLTPEDLCNRLA